jgi:hypothetical protein
MKTMNNISRSSTITLAAVLVTALTAAISANAQYQPTGDDGITASPKVRQQLDERRARSTPALAAIPTMSCPMCKDTWVAQADTNPKGLGARTLMGRTTRPIVKHQCDGRGTDWSLAGTGKAKHAVATHKCTGCGAEDLACCSKKSSGSTTAATKGMDQRIQVAPLK